MITLSNLRNNPTFIMMSIETKQRILRMPLNKVITQDPHHSKVGIAEEVKENLSDHPNRSKQKRFSISKILRNKNCVNLSSVIMV